MSNKNRPSSTPSNTQNERTTQPGASTAQLSLLDYINNQLHRPFCNSISDDDRNDIAEEVVVLVTAVTDIRAKNGRIEIPCDARWWEYGSALKLINLLRAYKQRPVDIVDIGSGWGALGPAVLMHTDNNVIEYEPDQVLYGNDRRAINSILQGFGSKEIYYHGFDIFNMPAQDYDVVSCISVLEHVPVDREIQAWRELVSRIRPQGILFITTDLLPEKGKSYMFDEMRAQNYTIDDLKSRVEILQEMGLKVIGTPEWKYNGDKVHNQYSFFRVGLVKE